MTRPVDILTTTDHVNGYHRPVTPCPGRDRTLNIRITRRWPGEGHEIHVWGPGMLELYGQPNVAALDADEATLRGWVDSLYRQWTSHAIEWHDPEDDTADSDHRYPFADFVDVSRGAQPWRVDEMWLRLARAGYDLFALLFSGTEELERLGARLAEALADREHTITVSSDSVVIPWPMLYAPATPPPAEGPFAVDMSAFVGYRHVIEHRFLTIRGPDPDIRYGDRLRAGAHVDGTLDRRSRWAWPGSRPDIIKPVIERLHQQDVTIRSATSGDMLRAFLRGGLEHDHLIYFCCHCEVKPPEPALLRLENGDTVSAADIDAWLRGAALVGGPLVMVNACQIANVASGSPSHIGVALLKHKAGCLLGPVVNIPMVFAGAFAEDFFAAAVAQRQRFGPAVRAVTRDLADRFRNPFGLSYTLFHGIDGHFCRHSEVPGQRATTEG